MNKSPLPIIDSYPRLAADPSVSARYCALVSRDSAIFEQARMALAAPSLAPSSAATPRLPARAVPSTDADGSSWNSAARYAAPSPPFRKIPSYG